MWIQLLKTTSCRCIQQNYTVLEIVVLHFIFTHIFYIQNNLLRMQGRQQERNCWCAQRTCHGPLARESELHWWKEIEPPSCNVDVEIKRLQFWATIITSLGLKHWNIQLLSYNPYIIWMKGSIGCKIPDFSTRLWTLFWVPSLAAGGWCDLWSG